MVFHKSLMIKLGIDQFIEINQFSFIHRCQIVDNIIIVQKTTQIMRSKKEKKWYMPIDIDIKKVYDILSQDFIKDTHKMVGFVNNWLDCIVRCIYLQQV